MKRRMCTKAVSALLVLLMIVGLLPSFALPVLAQEQLTISTVGVSGIPVPKEFQYAAPVDSSSLELQMPEAYTVVTDTLYWQDASGNTIDNDRYIFEAGRTYYLKLLLRIADSANYVFASKVTATLGGVSASEYTAQVFYPASGQILVQFGFKIPGAQTFPDITEVTLTNLMPPVVGEKPVGRVEMLYNNCDVTTAAYNGTLSGGAFVAGNTYRLSVTLVANNNYKFSENVKIKMDGMTPVNLGVTTTESWSQATATFEYKVSGKQEVDTLIIENGVDRPLAGRQYQAIKVANIELPFASEYKMYAVGSWKDQNGQIMQSGDRFQCGYTYRIRLAFKLKDASTRVFSQSPNVYVKSMSNWKYDIEIQSVEANRLDVDLVVQSNFLSGEGLTESNPAVCYSVADLKGALESTSICYVSLRDISAEDSRGSLGTPPKGDADTYFFYITTWGTKVLSLDGMATLQSHWKERSGYNKVGGLIYNTGNLTITGDGTLQYLAPVTSGYNAAIMNRGTLTVESGTVESYVTALSSVNINTGVATENDKHACAIYQKLSSAKLTINGGSLLTQRMVEKATGQGAVIVENGTAVINDGTLGYDVRLGVTDQNCYGLLIKDSAAKVTISKGLFQNIRFPASVAPSKYIASGRKVLSNGTAVNLTTPTAQLTGKVQVCQVVNDLSVYISSPTAGETVSRKIDVINGAARLYGGSKAVVWYDMTDKVTMNDTHTFIPGHRYRVTLELEAAGNFRFGDGMSATVNNKNATAQKISSQPSDQFVKLTYEFDACAAQITHVDVTIQPPFAGRASATGVSFGNSGVELYSLDWVDMTTDRFMSEGEPFIDGRSYKVQIWIKASKGYAFQVDDNWNPVVTGTVNGKSVQVGVAYDQSADEVVRIVYSFGVCDTNLDFVNVFNLDLPQPGAAPDFDVAVQEMDKYQIEHIRWSGPEGLLLEQDRFQPGVEYQVEIKLVPAQMNGLPLYQFSGSCQGYINATELKGDEILASSKFVYIYGNYTCPETATQVSLSGQVTSSGSTDDPIVLMLGNDTICYETTAAADGSYSFPSVNMGTYTLTVSKKGHISKTLTVNLNSDQTIGVTLEKGEDTGLRKVGGVWYYYKDGQVATGMTTLVKYNGEWWYVVNGKVASDMTTLVKYNSEWWYVVKGKIASGTTTLVKYNGEWWYVVKGKIAAKTTTLVKYNNEWWYVVNGKIASKTTTLVKYNNEWWYVVKGKIASNTTTLVQYNGGWYYLVKGKLAAKTTTLVKYNGVWYYVKEGKVDFSYTGTFYYNGKNYKIQKGRVV